MSGEALGGAPDQRAARASVGVDTLRLPQRVVVFRMLFPGVLIHVAEKATADWAQPAAGSATTRTRRAC